ncbi:conserved hypothetical protein [Ricinus communis]|uniref:Uncharacterized protein n=1 Tax=Ricinus communis TaxID=3988 RepID=B9TNY6_RICCO|nr:conserved hypothetical protein [Ricinus communis]
MNDHDRALVRVDCHANWEMRRRRPRRRPVPNDEFVQFRPATIEGVPSLRGTSRKSSAGSRDNASHASQIERGGPANHNMWGEGTDRRLRRECAVTSAN